LVDAQTENLIWSKRYSRQQTDLASLQMKIVRDVAQKLKTKLSGADEQNVAKNNTANTEAYQLYLRGRYHYNKLTDDGYYKGIEYFTQATAIDANYALAYTGLADCYFGLSDQFKSPNEVMPRARAAAEKALSLDGSLAEAHASLGLVKMFYDHAWDEAEAEFQRAIELDPNYANAHLFYGRLLMSRGRYDEAVKEAEAAIRIEPLSPTTSSFLGYVMGFAGRTDEALAQFNKALELNEQFPITHYYLGSIYQARGELDKAASEYEKAFNLNRNARYLMALGNVYAASGQREKALSILSQLIDMKKEQYVSAYYLAAVYAGLDEKAQTFALLNTAFEDHSDSLAGMKYSPLMRNLASHPRYKEMIRRAGLPE
jgi:eukaryotic-like serine/threonine-protein kinase